MRFLIRRYACLCLLLLILASAKAQDNLSGTAGNDILYSTASATIPVTDSNANFTIREITLHGNKKTRPATILRELSFQKEEAYPLNIIVEKFQETQKQLMNTGLFRSVVVSMQSLQGFDVFVKIEVEERWYLYPIPYVRIVDANLQQWWTERKRDLNRVNYGIKLNYNNVTGRGDELNLYMMNGFTKQASLRYEGLYLDKKMKWSANLSLSMGKKKEVDYMTVNNKPVALKDNNHFIHSYFRSSVDVIYRRAIKARHIFTLGYYNESVADTVYQLNPKFAHKKTIRYPELGYRLTWFDVDFIPYPTRGYIAEVNLVKKGFNDPVNLWQLTLKGSGTWPLSKRTFFNLRVAGMLKLPLEQPYITQRFLGGDELFLQGYEYYMVDGVAGGYGKAVLLRQVLNKTIHIPSKKIKRLNNIPLKVFAKAFVNGGYIYNSTPGLSLLNNKALYSTGFGLDILTFTDFIIKLECSFNQLGENGLYLHRRNYF
jgi:outer membrane protein assembly factor BamA